MKRKGAALLQAIGSVIALSPTISPAVGAPVNSVAALRQDAMAVRGDFQKAMVSTTVEKPNNSSAKR